MRFGKFDDAGKEYVISTPKTPYPWINYLGNEDFFTLISNTGGGYSFYKDARLRRITRFIYNNPNLDTNGKYFYINDDGDVWNPGWKPVKNQLDEYECRHGMGYSVITGKKNGVEVEVRFFGEDHRDTDGSRLKVPHMGWNQVGQTIDHPLWQGIDDGARFYFVHSYYVDCADRSLVAGHSEYGVGFDAALARDNLFAVQFHPEKSADAGLQLLRNFLHWNGQP